VIPRLAEYEALQQGRVSEVTLHSLEELSDALIRGRLAAGLTRRELAERIGVREQQIQRYEATRYAAVRLERAQTIVDAIGLTVEERATFPAGGRDQAVG
jgi:transcriptional regulator with XRE-family HTH domain